MKRYLALAASGIGLFALCAPAGASGDYSCYPDWRMPGRSHCAETAMLSPGNDTRVNLLFLLRDRQGLAPAGPAARGIEDYAYGRTFLSWSGLQRAFYPGMADDDDNPAAGTRCQSLRASTPAFLAAIGANRGVPAAERALLETARGRLSQTCGDGEPVVWPAGISSAVGRDFLGYVQGADAFYAGRWDEARGAFARLARTRDPWLAETASYMIARTELNAAQATAFSDYGDFDGPAKVDQAALQRARDGLAAYLKRYPAGRYAASAQGLVRRTLWLAGDVQGLSREYERLLGATSGTKLAAAQLVQEIDYKLLMNEDARGAIDGPLLLATLDLMRMRSQDETGKAALSLAELEAQRPRFGDRADLFGYLVASHHFHVGRDARKVLELIPDEARVKRYSALAFSRQVLRGMALAQLKDRNEAGFWRELIGGAETQFQRPVVELALALSLERSGRLAEVFAANSPIGDSTIREILLAATAGPALLRAQATDQARPRHERDVALFALLHKQLARGFYADFLRDRALIPAGANTDAGVWAFPLQQDIPVGLFARGTWAGGGYACPALAETAGALARNPADAKAKLCLGEFYRLNGFDDYRRSSDWRGEAETPAKPLEPELGSGPEQFPGKTVRRDELYAQVIADPRAPAGEKAYALYRAINCYAPGGNNSCSAAQVDLSVRRGWFQQLKRDYPASSWAKQLRYFW